MNTGKRKPEVKAITIKVRTTLSNATLRLYAEEAARKLCDWVRVGSTSESPVHDDPEIRLATRRVKVEGVGSR